MSVYSIRYFTPQWAAQPNIEEAQTLPHLSETDRAIATRLDAPGEQYWDGSHWSRGKPADLEHVEKRRAAGAYAEHANTKWLDAHAGDLTKLAKTLVNARPALSLMDIMYPSQRLREWAARAVQALGGHPYAADWLCREPRRWINL